MSEEFKISGSGAEMVMSGVWMSGMTPSGRRNFRNYVNYYSLCTIWACVPSWLLISSTRGTINGVVLCSYMGIHRYSFYMTMGIIMKKLLSSVVYVLCVCVCCS